MDEQPKRPQVTRAELLADPIRIMALAEQGPVEVLNEGGEVAGLLSFPGTFHGQRYRRLREKLAALEHQQWAHWTRYFLDNLTEENLARWRRQVETPYEALSEKEKASDRVWADRALALVSEAIADGLALEEL